MIAAMSLQDPFLKRQSLRSSPLGRFFKVEVITDDFCLVFIEKELTRLGPIDVIRVRVLDDFGNDDRVIERVLQA
jgi:hypothetical protein